MALTEEDKEWIGTQLQRVERKIERVESGVKTQMEGVERKVERIETELKTEIERVETNLLTAFHKWASPLEMRQRTHSAAIRALDEEMEALDDRVKKLEPPAL